MSCGLTSCGSSEGGAGPGSLCLEGKECPRQSPPQPVCGSAGSQKGPDCRVLTPKWQPCAPRPQLCQRLYEITGGPRWAGVKGR